MSAAATKLNELFVVHNAKAHVVGETAGPTVTRYEVELAPGVTVEKILRLHKTIGLALATESVRMLAPIPGKSLIGIEAPTTPRRIVGPSEVPIPAAAHPLTVPLGLSVDGQPMAENLARFPHVLVAGATGSGKSSFLNAMLTTLIARTRPDVVRLVLVDPKMVELAPYEHAPHVDSVVTEVPAAAAALARLADLMDSRYRRMRQAGVRTADAYNAAAASGRLGPGAVMMPYIVCVVDELADLVMLAKGAVEDAIVRLGQKARAAGIHLVLATQRPSADVVTGLIKANVPSRIAFKTASAVDSRVALDTGGAQLLLGAGDGLYRAVDTTEALRFQAPLVGDAMIAATVDRARARWAPAWPQEDHDNKTRKVQS
ncbi:DNA translocase FtsK [Amycolatopsis cynarae]|uniref:DNA translocase FtsK n=1 Tax=Amycolatopsis cynarae TaxID=2995223 RepID=A0ABY7B6R2_9PSEU|nr:DNA translocase FtsK [Amycolatopsis sp. HUAS 11-8]WAL67119.1 DNA translocase FtsK [Amycolatopsis sp. HUAS 11-8]